jgi:hypothetical protein
MIVELYLFVILSFLLAVCSFAFWLRPEAFFKNWRPFKQFRQIDFDRFTLIASLSGILLFVCCFAFGAWLSIQKIKGNL